MMFPSILKRYFAVVTLSLIALIAYLQARAVTLLASILLDAVVPMRPSLPAVAATPTEPKSGQAIIDRNPFDSTPRPPERASAKLDLSDPLSWPSCPNVQVAIVTQSSDPLWSLSTVRTSGEPRARLRRFGDKVADEQVAFIGYNPKQMVPSVWLEAGESSCQSSLFLAQAQAVTAPLVIPTPPEARTGLSRGDVEKVLENPLAALSRARFVPEQKDGRPVGIRLFGIQPTSLLGTLGLKSGDRLEAINGLSMASPQRALEAYAQLRTASRLDVHVVRSGKPVDLTLRID
jgi:general secretion pathway protein C